MRGIIQQSRKIIWLSSVTGLLVVGVGAIRAQETMGSLGAGMSGSATLDASSGVNAGRSFQRARGIGNRSMDEAGADEGGSGGSGAPPGGSGSGGGYPGAGGAGGGVGALPPPPDVIHFSTGTGQSMLNELLATNNLRSTYPNPERPRRSSRAQATYSRRVRAMSAKQRSKMVMAKYKIPPVNWLAYYLSDDRYKLKSGLWQYVSIEDDPRAYPMRYYYRPWAAPILNLIGHSPRGLHRYNRIIGFASWQDAVLAGYRPDPVSRPEPGSQIAAIARLTRGPHLERYVEYVYSGQVAPATFASNYSYIQRVATTLNGHAHTRPLVGQTVDQVLGAILGEGRVPRYVGGPPPAPRVAAGSMGSGGGYPGAGGGYPGGSGGGYPGGSGGYPGGSTAGNEQPPPGGAGSAN